MIKSKVIIGSVKKHGSPGIIDDFDCTISFTINHGGMIWERIGFCVRKISMSSLTNIEEGDSSKTFILTKFKEDKQYRTKLSSTVITDVDENDLLKEVAKKVSQWRENKINIYTNNNFQLLLEL